jgi:hypothetical protein
MKVMIEKTVEKLMKLVENKVMKVVEMVLKVVEMVMKVVEKTECYFFAGVLSFSLVDSVII